MLETIKKTCAAHRSNGVFTGKLSGRVRWGSADRQHDVLAVTWALAEPFVIGLETRQGRPLDRVLVPAVDEDAEADIGQGELLAGDIGVAAQRAFEDRPHADRLPARVCERRHVALLWRGAVIPEEQRRHRRAERGGLP